MELQESKLNINDYIRLYNSGFTLDKIKPLKNQTYAIFSRNKTKARIVNRKEVYKDPMAFQKIKHFVNDNEYFYMIPIETVNETIVGFIIRGVLTKGYVTISRVFNNPAHQIRLMYGFNKSFKKYDEGKKCYPIIVCEGCKDCIALKKIYPYVLANNTSSMGLNANILRNISDRFLLAYDNDSAGEDGMKRDKEVLRGMGAYVDSLKLPEGVKDCADYLYTEHGDFNTDNYYSLKNQITRKVKQLYSI